MSINKAESKNTSMLCAVIQMNSKKNIDENLDAAYELLKEASVKGAVLAVLPEMFACLGVKNQKYLALSRFHSQDVLSIFSGWAKDLSMYLVCGSVPISIDGSQKVAASSLVYSPEGKLLSDYQKIHLFDVVLNENESYRESDTFIAGNKSKTVMIADKNLGLSICYDLRFPELYQKYQQQHCQIITVPSAFTYQTGKQHWEVLLRARAIETQCFILAANQVGIHEDGRRTWGHSMIISPNGDILAQAEKDEPCVVIAELDFNMQQVLKNSIPLLNHKRLV